MNAIELGEVNKTTSSRMQELEKQLEELERQMIVERSKTNIKISEEEIREYYKNALLQEPLMFINYLIKEIKLYNDKVEFIFNIPLRISPDNQGFFIYNKIYENDNSKSKQS